VTSKPKRRNRRLRIKDVVAAPGVARELRGVIDDVRPAAKQQRVESYEKWAMENCFFGGSLSNPWNVGMFYLHEKIASEKSRVKELRIFYRVVFFLSPSETHVRFLAIFTGGI